MSFPSQARCIETDIAIIGAGIAGVALAVGLKKRGFNVQIFERAEILREIGGAIVIRQPSLELFDSWGLAKSFYKSAVRVPTIEIRNSKNEQMSVVDFEKDAQGQAYSVHRADVHNLLLGAVDRDWLHIGKQCTGVTTGDDFAFATFGDGSSVCAKLIVGSDGIKSVARTYVANDELVFSKLVVLRSIAPASALPKVLSNDRLYLIGEPPRMLVLLPLRSGREVALDTIMVTETQPKDLWTSEVSDQVLVDFFSGFDSSITDLIRSGSVSVKANPVYERNPISTWSRGRVTLIGDAAHPMAPRMGQGANMAIQDVPALVSALEEFGLENISAALKAYEGARVGPTAQMQIASRQPPMARKM